LDVVLLVGRLRLREHRTVDEIHRELLTRLEPLGVKIARREILYLFEAYCTLLRAASEAKDDVEWLSQVEKNGGIIVSVDGIQPEKGNETVYLVRDALTGRVLAAENVLSSETAVMKALLAPIATLNRDGTAPFDFAAVQAGEDLDEVAQSLERLAKKGEP